MNCRQANRAYSSRLMLGSYAGGAGGRTAGVAVRSDDVIGTPPGNAVFCAEAPGGVVAGSTCFEQDTDIVTVASTQAMAGIFRRVIFIIDPGMLGCLCDERR